MGTQVRSEFVGSNQNRAYPIDERATQIADDGTRLPENLLIDCHIWWPLQAHARLFLSSITVTKSLITATFSATDGRVRLPSGGPFTSGPTNPDVPIASIGIRTPLDVGRLYAVTGIVAGVGGWVSFGEGANSTTEINLLFSNHTQSLLVADAAVEYQPNLVTSIGKEGSSVTLGGLVTVKAGNDLKIAKENRLIDGIARDAFVLSMDKELVDLERMKKYIGTCLGSPEAGTCSEQPIFRINSVTPDCSGNITLNVTGATVQALVNNSGILIRSDSELDALCAHSVAGVGSINYTGSLSGPFLADLNTTLPTTSSTVGDFTFRSGVGAFIQENCRLRPSQESRSIATVESSSKGRTFHVTANLWSGSAVQNAFIVLGFLDSSNFWFAGIERDTDPGGDITKDRLIIGRILAGTRTIVAELSTVPLTTGTNYDIDVAVTVITMSSTQIALTVSGLGSLNYVAIPFADGRAGIYTENAISYFTNFAIDWVGAFPPAGPCLPGYGYGYGYGYCYEYDCAALGGAFTLGLNYVDFVGVYICGVQIESGIGSMVVLTALDPFNQGSNNRYFGTTTGYDAVNDVLAISSAFVTYDSVTCTYDVSYTYTKIKSSGAPESFTTVATGISYNAIPGSEFSGTAFFGTTSGCPDLTSLNLVCIGGY